MATVKISCETQDAKIMYTTDGSEPTESSNLYSDVFEVDSQVTIKARAFKEGYEPSDISTREYVPVTVPMALPDGSIIFYDLGEDYGTYIIGDDGYPVRLGSPYAWRFLICDKSDLADDKAWGPSGTSEGLTVTTIGHGSPNTETMIARYGDNASYLWKDIKQRRSDTGFDWFMPCKDELNILYENKDVVSSAGGVALQSTWYWSSSEYNNNQAWFQYFSHGYDGYDGKSSKKVCRLLRQI